MIDITLKELIKNTFCHFQYYRGGFFFYAVEVYKKEEIIPHFYRFPITLDDIGTATLNKSDKALLFMRWIRKAIKEETITKIEF